MSADAALRDLERAARGQPAAADWSALARALARAGRPWDAYGAAVQALALDPAEPVRDLLPPVPQADAVAETVPWPLGRPGPPRRLEVAGALLDLSDLGGGRALVHVDGRLEALDLITGEVGWSAATSSERPVVGVTHVAHVPASPSVVEVAILERASGREQGRVLVAELPEGGAGPSGEHDDDVHHVRLVLVEPGTVAVVTSHPGDARVAFVDLARGSIRARARVPGEQEGLFVVGLDGAVVLRRGGGLVAIEPDGRTRWTVAGSGADSSWPACATGESLICMRYTDDSVRLEAHALATGSRLARLHLPSAPPHAGRWTRVVGAPDAVLGSWTGSRDVDARNVVVCFGPAGPARWSRRFGGLTCSIAATSDAVLVARAPYDGPIAALDPTRGEPLWEHVVPAPFTGPPRPLAGHLVFEGPRARVGTSLLAYPSTWSP